MNASDNAGSLRRTVQKTRRLRPHRAATSVARAMPTGGIVVKVTEDIPADDYDLHEVTVQSLVDGEWEDSDATIQVRSPLEQDIVAGTRHIARQVGSLGWCIRPPRATDLRPFNIGIPAGFHEAMDAAGQLSSYNYQDDWSAKFPLGFVWYDLTPEDIPANNYPINDSQKLQAVCVGAPLWGFSGGGWPDELTASSTTTQLDNAQKAVDLTFVPEEGTDEDDAILTYLENGGTVILNADVWAVFWEVTSGGDGRYDHLWSPVTDKIDAVNAYLTRLGSSTQLVPTAIAEDSDAGLTGCYPLSGVTAVNPDNWLGKNRFAHRIIDESLTTLNAARHALRGGHDTLTAAGTLNDFHEFTLPYDGTHYFRRSAFGSDVGWTSTRRMLQLTTTEPTAIFYQIPVGRVAWDNTTQYPTTTHTSQLETVYDSVSWYRYVSKHTNAHEIADVSMQPVITAERLPGGGKLVVICCSNYVDSVTNPFLMAFEALSRLHRGNPTEQLSHQAYATNSTSVSGVLVHDRAGTIDSELLSTSPVTKPWTLPMNRSPEGVSQVYLRKALGSGLLTGPEFLTTDSTTETPTPQHHHVVADVSKVNWTGHGSTTQLWSNVDEETASDDEYNWSPNDTAATLTLKFEEVSLTASPYVVKYRLARLDNGEIEADAGNDVTATVSLLRGSTTIATDTVRTLNAEWTTYEWTLTSTQTDSVLTNVADIRIKVEISASGPGAGARGAGVSWVEITSAGVVTFEALLATFSPYLWHPGTDLSLCPAFSVWVNTHSDFTTHISTNGDLKWAIAYHADDLTEFADADLLSDVTLDGADWYRAFPLALPSLYGVSGVPDATVSAFHVQRDTDGIRGWLWFKQYNGTSWVTVKASRVPVFPIVFQSGRFLIPESHAAKLDQLFVTGVATAFVNCSRMDCAVKKWRDVTNWPEEGDLYDVVTGADAPPLMYGTCAIVDLPYGVGGIYRYEYSAEPAGDDWTDWSMSHDADAVQANYGE